MARHLSTQRRSAYGHAVVTVVDDQLRRRTIAVPFERSSGPELAELIEHVCNEVPFRPTGMYDNGG